MKIHHLNCASLHPIGYPLIPKLWVCHCLLLDIDGRLILVDTGLGLANIVKKKEWLGQAFMKMARPVLNEKETAIRQIEQLGYAPQQVSDIILTHLDLDHTGGLPDFPHARVHTTHDELEAARHAKSRRDQRRYSQHHWTHGPKWVVHEYSGSTWFDFKASGPILDLRIEIYMIALAGHSQGHCGVAIKTAGFDASTYDWILHAGDAYFSRDEIAGELEHTPKGIKFFEKLAAVDNELRIANQNRLFQLLCVQERLQVFCSHDAKEFAELF